MGATFTAVFKTASELYQLVFEEIPDANALNKVQFLHASTFPSLPTISTLP